MENSEVQSSTSIHEARIPTEKISNYTALASKLQEIRRLPKDQQPEALQALLEKTPLHGSKKDTLLDEALSQVTRPETQEPTEAEELFRKASEEVRAKVKQRVEHPEFEGLVVKIDDKGNVTDVLVQKIYPRKNESSARKLQERIPYGPGRLIHVPDAVGEKVKV